MLNKKIKTISFIVTAALLSGCSSSGGMIAPPTATGTPLATCTANTSCGMDAVTVSMPVNIQTGVGQVTTVTGSPTVLGATTITATLNPITKNPTSATFSGGVNTSVTLTPQDVTNQNPGSFAGTALNGQSVLLTTFNKANLAIGLNGVGLTYSDFGEWSMKPTATGAGTATYSVWAGGTQPTSAMPTTGSAAYTGITRGVSLVANTPYQLNGNLTLTANFTAAGGTISGSITGITAATFPGNGIPGTSGVTTLAGGFNNIALAGTISGNAFSGTAIAGPSPSALSGPHPAAIAAGTTGTTSGHFYGPTANEVTGMWSMSTATVQAMGSFGAK